MDTELRLFIALLQILLFLIVCPFLVVFAFCWIVVKAFYNYLRDLSIKEAVAAVYSSNNNNNGTGGNQVRENE